MSTTNDAIISMLETLMTNNFLLITQNETRACCIGCANTFSSKDVRTINWDSKTCVCPICSLDAVIGASHVPNQETLKFYRSVVFGNE